MDLPTPGHLKKAPGFPLEAVEGWGMACTSRCYVARPRSAQEIRRIFREARACGLPVGLRGAGCSYGDAAINDRGILLDLTHFNRILAFDEESGVLEAEPGVTIEQVWRHVLPRGFWPPVVPGTMFPTLGGCAAMNIHGKNCFQAGTIGEHVEDFDLLLPSGETRRCSRDENEELFHAAIGGIGMLGVFTRLSLRMKRVHSGDVRVRPIVAPSLEEMIRIIEDLHESSDYLVGWIDAFARGASLGRGLIHQACYLKRGEDPEPTATRRISHQVLPSRLFGVIPKGWMWAGLWCFLNQPGMRLINALKYAQGRRRAREGVHRQSLVGFSFLLDYVPNWKFAYKPGGLIQYQSFVPRDAALEVFEEILTRSQERGIIPYLGVLKKHRPDPFLLTHGLDGYSLALDFPVRESRRSDLWSLAAELDDIVASAGGRFYFAKDLTMTTETLGRSYPPENVRRFLDLKAELDPGGLLQTDLYRRLFAPLAEGVEMRAGTSLEGRSRT